MPDEQLQNIPSATEMLETAKLQIIAETFLEGSLDKNGNRVPAPRENPYAKKI